MEAIAVSLTTAQRSPLHSFRSASALSFLKITTLLGMSDTTKPSPSRWIATARFGRWNRELVVAARDIEVHLHCGAALGTTPVNPMSALVDIGRNFHAVALNTGTC